MDCIFICKMVHVKPYRKFQTFDKFFSASCSSKNFQSSSTFKSELGKLNLDQVIFSHALLRNLHPDPFGIVHHFRFYESYNLHHYPALERHFLRSRAPQSQHQSTVPRQSRWLRLFLAGRHCLGAVPPPESGGGHSIPEQSSCQRFYGDSGCCPGRNGRPQHP